VIYALTLNGQFLHAKEQLEDGLIRLAVTQLLLDELAVGREGTSRDWALATLRSDEIGRNPNVLNQEIRILLLLERLSRPHILLIVSWILSMMLNSNSQ
jgi:hypothetical protein